MMWDMMSGMHWIMAGISVLVLVLLVLGIAALARNTYSGSD
jgi:hypothetical protein